MYKVFIKDKAIRFTENINNEEILKAEKVIKYDSFKDLSSEFQRFTKSRKKKDLIVVRKKNVDKLFKRFISIYQVVKASGGMVINKKKQILLIYRDDRWDLPKGKNNKKESNKVNGKNK